MMPEVVILDFSIPEINRYPEINLEFINDNFIGSEWLTDLIRELTTLGIPVKGSRHIASCLGLLRQCSRIHVISNRVSWVSRLLHISPRTRVSYINLESPLFELELYKAIDNNKLSTKSTYMGFSGGAKAAFNMRFISWPGEVASNLAANRNRDIFCSMMCSNNYKAKAAPFPSIKYPWRVLNYLLDKISILKNPLYAAALHSTTSIIKLELIRDGATRGLQLYGSRWNNLDFLPKDFQERLRSPIRTCYRGRAPEKSDIISRSIFSFAIENTRISGYVTEKLIDCLRYGAIPIYFGAPNISDYFRVDCFIDGSAFDNFYDLFDFLDSMKIERIEEYRKAGQTALVEYCSKWSRKVMVDSLISDITTCK